MSMLFVIFIPVREPEAFVNEDDIYVGSGRSTRTVSVSALYSLYLDKIRLARGGTENPVPIPQPDQPAPPPVLPKKTTAQSMVKTLLGLREAIAKRPDASDSKQAASKTPDSDNLILPLSHAGKRQHLEMSNSAHVPVTSEHQHDNLSADDVALIPKEKRKPKLAQEPDDDDDAVEEKEDKHLNLRKVLIKILDSEGVENAFWRMTENLDYWKVTFVTDTSICDLVLNSLVTFGFGKITGTSVSLFPSSYYSGEGQLISGQERKIDFKGDGDEKSEFAKSVKARLTVAQVLGAVKTNACITFDFLILITAASLIAALGLAENSTVSIVASMLISPMMGPVIGITFGICIKSAELWKLAVKNECICLGFCVAFGYIFGIITAIVNLNGAYWGGSDSWPTTEMSNRGMLRSLWVGVLIASASGLGVALAILGGNVGSLVGVAISASILPPAVNGGVLWGHATVWAIRAPEYDYIRLAAGKTFQKLDPSCPFLLKNEYQFTYTCQAYLETLILGTVSILLTVVNIVCIFIVAIAVLKVKEVAPNVNFITTKTPTDVFWRTDVPMVRNIQKKSREADLPRMASQFTEEYRSLKTESEKKKLVQKWQTIIGSLEDDPVYSHTTQHLTGTMPEIFRRLSRLELEPLSESVFNRYNRQTTDVHQAEARGMFGTIHGIASTVGQRLWSWIPFTGTTEIKPEGAEPVPGRPTSKKKSFSWAPSTFRTTEDHHDTQTMTRGRFVVSPVQDHP